MFDLMRKDTRNIGERKARGGYAQYDVLLAMFCNEWTWVTLKNIQIEKVERNERRLRPCGRLKEKTEDAPLLYWAKIFYWHVAFN
jgi:hypothetical protein